MPNPLDRHNENAAGKWYVTTFCIDCDICREIAPGHFKQGEYGGQGDVFVYKQPVSQTEVDLCKQAKAECPVDAIGDDGE